jgi:hypothetical protein
LGGSLTCFLVLLSIRTFFSFCVCVREREIEREREREREFFVIIFLNVLSIHSILTGFGGGWCVQFLYLFCCNFVNIFLKFFFFWGIGGDLDCEIWNIL